MTNFLFLDARTGDGAANCAGYQYVNGTPTKLGTGFGTPYSVALNPTRTKPKNGLIQFQGELYAMAGDGIYKKDDPTVTTGGWTQQISFTTPDIGAPRYSGLHAIEVGGVMTVVGVFGENTAPDRWRWVKFDGTTWTQAGVYTELTTAMDFIQATQVYRGGLYMFWMSASNSIYSLSYDPSSDSFSQLAHPFENGNLVMSMCEYQGRLFAIGTDFTSTLAEFTGGSWSTVFADYTNPALGNNGSNNADGLWALLTDGVYMYALTAFIVAGVTRGWHCHRFDSSLNVVDLTFEVIPAALRPTGLGGSGPSPNSQRFYAVYDSDTDPANPEIFLYHAVNGISGTSFTVYQWNYDPANALGFGLNLLSTQDVGGDVYHSVPDTLPQGGCRIFTPGELDVKIVNRVGILGGEQITFRAYGGGTGRKFKMFYSIGGDPNLLEATLMTPVTGGSATFNGGLNQVEGIAADGATDYTIVWDIAANSVVPGIVIDRFPQVTV